MRTLDIQYIRYSEPFGIKTLDIEEHFHHAKQSLSTQRTHFRRDTHDFHTAILLQKMYCLWVAHSRTFEDICTGKKTIEGRLWKGSLRTLKKNQVIYICCNKHKIAVRIMSIRRYPTFHRLLSYKDNLHKTLYNASSLQEGVTYYNNIYDKRNIMLHGVVGITVTRLVLSLK